MTKQTKACNLTADEIHNLISHHCCTMTEDKVEYKMERLNYLHKRLKAFKEDTLATNSYAAQIDNAAQTVADKSGWK